MYNYIIYTFKSKYKNATEHKMDSIIRRETDGSSEKTWNTMGISRKINKLHAFSQCNNKKMAWLPSTKFY